MTHDTAPDSAKPSRFTRARALLFLAAALAIGIVVIALITWWVIGSAPRTQAVPIDKNITVAEYIALPDDDSYPAALARAADGALYTGSYQTGALWSIAAGRVHEIPHSRQRIGSVSGLDIAPDGALFILDRIKPLEAQGAVIWRYAAGDLSPIAQIPNDKTIGLVLPDDIAIDSAGFIYISDRDPPRVWRYTLAGDNQGIWWQPPDDDAAPTGLAYDPARNAILITDSAQDAIYRVSAEADDLPAARRATETLYQDDRENGYGLDGIAASPQGDVYVALLAWNRIARLDADGLTMLAKDFRGASDLVYDPQRDTLFVTNWNQFSLGFGTRPQLPFALDAVDLSPGG